MMHIHKENKKLYIYIYTYTLIIIIIIIMIHARVISELTKISVSNCKLLSLSKARDEHVFNNKLDNLPFDAISVNSLVN